MTKSRGLRKEWRPIVQRVWDGSSPEECRAAFSAAYAIVFNSPAAKETIRAARAERAAERLEKEQQAAQAVEAQLAEAREVERSLPVAVRSAV